MTTPLGSASRLLIVDDDPLAVQALGQVLKGLGEVRFALNAADGLAMALTQPPDLILLDAELPDLDGLSLCRQLKAESALMGVPIVFITGHGEEAREVAALEAGADDFVRKPPHPAVVRARVRTQLRLKGLSDALRLQAMRDGLTGVANRATFDLTLQREVQRALRRPAPLGTAASLSLAMVDVDHFKRYNDRHGHPAGDACLRQVAMALQSVLHRPGDLLARYGGEEFVALLPETPAEGARHVAQRLCAAVAGLRLPHAASEVAAWVTVSVGVATLGGGLVAAAMQPPAAAAALVQAADGALYEAKHQGRARVAAALGSLA